MTLGLYQRTCFVMLVLGFCRVCPTHLSLLHRLFACSPPEITVTDDIWTVDAQDTPQAAGDEDCTFVLVFLYVSDP